MKLVIHTNKQEMTACRWTISELLHRAAINAPGMKFDAREISDQNIELTLEGSILPESNE